MEHRGPSEWVRCGSKTRHIIAVFSHVQLHAQSPTEKSASLGKCHLITRWPFPGRKGQVLPRLRQVVQVLAWTWTQVAFGTCLPGF